MVVVLLGQKVGNSLGRAEVRPGPISSHTATNYENKSNFLSEMTHFDSNAADDGVRGPITGQFNCVKYQSNFAQAPSNFFHNDSSNSQKISD